MSIKNLHILFVNYLITRTKNVHKYEVRGKKIVIRLEKERERKKEIKIE